MPSVRRNVVGRQTLRQRNTYTGLPSVYDIPRSRAKPEGIAKHPGKYDWDSLLALGEHREVPVPENLSRTNWIAQLKRTAEMRNLTMSIIGTGTSTDTVVNYRVTDPEVQ